jgi:hypothetical protein
LEVHILKTISEKVSYLHGLIDGLGVGEDTKEGKVIKSIAEILEDMADAIGDLDQAEAELDEYVEAIDEDLADVEEAVYGEEDEDEDDGFVEVECPNCHETVYLDEELFDNEDEELICPNCHEPIHFECECCGDDECECEHEEE